MYNKENKRRREPWEMSFLKVNEKNIKKSILPKYDSRKDPRSKVKGADFVHSIKSILLVYKPL